MGLQPSTPPQDITWTRMAFSRDMIDTNFGGLVFGPKWRSSLAISYYLVPPEQTADGYPNSRIVYLKLTSSITGYNPSEELRAARTAAEEADTRDDLQRTLWDVIISSGWAATYWPCLGAILQIAVYPNSADGVAPDDYPFSMDFEPKKRELYKQVTQGSEFLARSAEKLSTTKGSTNTARRCERRREVPRHRTAGQRRRELAAGRQPDDGHLPGEPRDPVVRHLLQPDVPALQLPRLTSTIMLVWAGDTFLTSTNQWKGDPDGTAPED
jgi:hypothetical protein